MENVFILESNCANGVRLRHSRFTRNFMNTEKMVLLSKWEGKWYKYTISSNNESGFTKPLISWGYGYCTQNILFH